ncbi:hypothetical protein MKW98_017821, partial [Papaver atlanticum]
LSWIYRQIERTLSSRQKWICRLQILKMVNGILNIFEKKTAPKEALMVLV